MNEKYVLSCATKYGADVYWSGSETIGIAMNIEDAKLYTSREAAERAKECRDWDGWQVTIAP